MKRRRFGVVVSESSQTFEDGLSRMAVEELPPLDSSLREGEMLVDVEACCVNYPDVMSLTNSHQHKQAFPYTPGMEISGIVVEVFGKSCQFKPGDRVMSMCYGGLSTQIILHESQCLAVPETLTSTQAAAFRMGYETAYHSLVERANIQPNETVLVNGATGGMGLAAVQLAKLFNCTVIATGGSDEKLRVVKEVAGADHVINYKNNPSFKDIVKRLTKGKGVDIVYDTVGGSVFQEGLTSTAFGARVLIVGFTSGENVNSIPSNYVLIKCLAVMGCRAGELLRRTPDGMNVIAGPRYARLENFANSLGLVPHVSSTFEMTTDGVRQAFRALIDRKVVGRVCVIVSNGSTSKL